MPAPPRPASLEIPGQRVTAHLTRATTVRRTLVPPSDPAAVGLWSGGARPGATHGRIVLVGHTAHDGYAALGAAGSLHPGDRLVLRTASGTFRYAVTSLRTMNRAAFADRAAALLRRTGPPRLVLVTCTGWDGTAFRSNLVVVARPAQGL